MQSGPSHIPLYGPAAPWKAEEVPSRPRLGLPTNHSSASTLKGLLEYTILGTRVLGFKEGKCNSIL